jgi:hypothetical protein
VGGTSGGGPGTAGYAVFEFDVPGIIVNTSTGGWKPANETWIKLNDTWTRVTTAYVNQDGTWYPVNGYAPVFENVAGRFGASPRAAEIDPPPPPPVYIPPPWEIYSGERGGWEPSYGVPGDFEPGIDGGWGYGNDAGGTDGNSDGTGSAFG